MRAVTFADAFLFTGATLWILALFVGLITMIQGWRYLRPSLSTEVVSRRPLGMRLSAGLTGLGSLLSALGVAGTAPAGASLLFFCLCAPLALLLLLVSGPGEIRLDLERHTYRVVGGWPLFPWTAVGDWEKLFGLYVKETGNSRSFYLVGVAWRGGKGSMTLEQFARLEDATRFLEDLKTSTDLPQIIPQRSGVGSINILLRPP